MKSSPVATRAVVLNRTANEDKELSNALGDADACEQVRRTATRARGAQRRVHD
jgi:hypothetical protein